MFPLIKTLTEITGPVGQEAIIQTAIEKLWTDGGAKVERTQIGNLLGRVGGKGPKVLLAAHADELCYLVRAIHPDGFLWLANGQGWQRTASFRDGFTIGQRVRVLARSGEIPGVIAAVTGHVASLALPQPRELTWNDFWVDTGLSRDELLARGVTPGTRLIWEATTAQFGEKITGKALDNRVSVAILTELLRRVSLADLNCELTICATVQEEVGVVGASSLAWHERFDAGIIVESGLAGDYPGVPHHAMPIRLGDGPILVHKDSRVHFDHTLTSQLEQVAGNQNIPIQHAVFGSFGTDGSALMNAGIPAALIAFPTRYTHTPFEMAHMADIEAMVDWLLAFVTG